MLSEEQQNFVNKVLEGNNVLVDACIGSGKTTAIQYLCNELPKDNKILYLTYNKLLKLDAKKKIKNSNCFVTNYHGYAFSVLIKNGIKCGMSDLIQTFNKVKPRISPVDILILDEYQDIEQELAQMLNLIKEQNPYVQIVAVGDMAQKIYDKTTLDVAGFIEEFLEDHIQLEFTKCFRLSQEHAAMLGRVWQKPINGVNENCQIRYMTVSQAFNFLADQNPEDILCLGARTGDMAKTLNKLEEHYPDKFNKTNVFASIKDNGDGSVNPTSDSAIFTTFDSSKGMERKICVVFDYTEDYWTMRANQPMQSYEILRNIFCVAASRGKEQVIFVTKDRDRNMTSLLSEETLSTPIDKNEAFKDVNISTMFDFKYKEDIEEAFNCLKTHKIDVADTSVINIRNSDGLIDLSPCIGIYQEAMFFDNYDIDEEFELRNSLMDEGVSITVLDDDTLDTKILRLTSHDTKQKRYINQVEPPFATEEELNQLKNRLSLIFSPDEEVQTSCEIPFFNKDKEHIFTAKGRTDVIKDNIIYELKFVSELSHEMFLQCACYLIALKKQYGALWNTKNNSMYLIEIPDRKLFMDKVSKAVTKGLVEKYYGKKNIKLDTDKENKKKEKKKKHKSDKSKTDKCNNT